MPSRDTPHLFVYGTLRRGGAAPMAAWLTSVADWIGTAQVHGRLYRVADYPGLVPDDHGGLVQGDLFRLPGGATGDAIRARLDDYEECSPAFPPPHEYARIIVPVLVQGVACDAWAYVYRHPTADLTEIESGDFLRDGVPNRR